MGLKHKLAGQFRRPEGLFGRLVGVLMSRANRRLNDWTIGLLDIRPADHVLEVGFGPGLTIEKIAAMVPEGKVTGIDFSETMVRQARKRNAPAIEAGRVELHYGTISSLSYKADTFDKVLAVNVIYFLPDPISSLAELRRVMKPGGRIAVYVTAKEDVAKLKVTQTPVFTLYNGEEVAQMLQEAGFNRAWFETTTVAPGMRGHCALAEK